MTSRFVTTFAVLLLAAVAGAADAPPATFIDRGACPFECCVYRTWQTRADTVAYARPDRGAPVVGRLKAGAPVEAVTGEVHSRPVRFVVKKPHGEFGVGESFWVYTYLGEGHFKVWRDGAMREVDLGFSPMAALRASGARARGNAGASSRSRSSSAGG